MLPEGLSASLYILVLRRGLRPLRLLQPAPPIRKMTCLSDAMDREMYKLLSLVSKMRFPQRRPIRSEAQSRDLRALENEVDRLLASQKKQKEFSLNCFENE